MNTDQIKQISIRALLAQSGITPAKETERGGMYFSPLREERTASFYVNYVRNLWYDHGIGEGGSIIELVMKMQNCNFVEAVRHLENRSGIISVSN